VDDDPAEGGGAPRVDLDAKWLRGISARDEEFGPAAGFVARTRFVGIPAAAATERLRFAETAGHDPHIREVVQRGEELSAIGILVICHRLAAGILGGAQVGRIGGFGEAWRFSIAAVIQ